MKRLSDRRTFLQTVLTAFFLNGSLCLDCTTLEDVGDLFSVMDLRCVNYTAEFRWRIINTQLADTLLHLSCHNTTNEFTHNIPLATVTQRNESHVILLTGDVECVLSGCYDDSQITFQRRLIPNITFSCQPAIIPTTSYPVTSSPTAVHTPPHTHTLSSRVTSTTAVHTPPLSHTLSSRVTSTATTIPWQSEQPLTLQLVIAIPVSAALGVLVILIFIIFCVWEANKRMNRSVKLTSLHENDKIDPNFKIEFLNLNVINVSTMTIYEPPLRDGSALVTTEVTLQSDANIDYLSLNSQTDFPLPCEDPDTPLESVMSTPNESDDSNIKPTLQPSQSTDHVIPTSEETSTNSCNTMSTGTYVHNNSDASFNNAPYGQTGEGLENSHFSISEFLDTVDNELNKECIEPGGHQLDTIHEDKNCDTDIRQWSGHQLHAKKLITHKNFKTNDGSGIHECDDELLTSLAERYGECSQTTSGSSGYGSGSYISNLNGCSTE